MTILECDDCGMQNDADAMGWEDGRWVCPDCGSPNLTEVESEDDDTE